MGNLRKQRKIMNNPKLIINLERLCSRDCPNSTPMLSCADCSFKCIYKDTLIYHMKQTHMSFEEGGGAYRCTICRFNTRTYGCMERHISGHERDLNPNSIFLRCEVCTFETILESRMAQHRYRCYLWKQALVCGQCNFTTNNGLILKYHLLRHKSPRQKLVYRCKQCTYKAFIKSKLWKHTREHIRPVFCCNSCDYNCYSLKRIERHISLPH